MLQLFAKGQPLRAEDMNAIVTAITQLQGAVGIVGGVGKTPVDAQGVPFAAGAGFWVRGIVARVNGADPNDPLTPMPAAVISYDIDLVGRGPAARLTNVKPDLGRPVEELSTTRIVPAQVGTKAAVLRFPAGDGSYLNYVVLSERLRARTC